MFITGMPSTCCSRNVVSAGISQAFYGCQWSSCLSHLLSRLLLVLKPESPAVTAEVNDLAVSGSYIYLGGMEVLLSGLSNELFC